MSWIKIKEAEQKRYCLHCNFAGRGEAETKPCNYHSHPSLNYRNVPGGMCALRSDDRERMEKDSGVSRGRVNKNNV